VSKRKKRHRSKVRQFYSDFNSDSSHSESADSDGERAGAVSDGGPFRRPRSRGRPPGRGETTSGVAVPTSPARVFTFDARAPKLRPERNGFGEEVLDDPYGSLGSSSATRSPRAMSPWGTQPRWAPGLDNPLSPGVTENQYLKDRAYASPPGSTRKTSASYIFRRSHMTKSCKFSEFM